MVKASSAGTKAPSAGAMTTPGCSISQVGSQIPVGPLQVQSSDAKFPLGPILPISSLGRVAAAQDFNPFLLRYDPLAWLLRQFPSAQTYT